MLSIKIYRHISRLLDKIEKKSFFARVVFQRKMWMHQNNTNKTEASMAFHLTEDNKRQIDKVWNGVKIDRDWLRFYNSVDRGDQRPFDARYVPLDIQYCLVDDWFNKTQAALLMDDKNMYDLYFSDVRMPNTVARIVDGRLMDKSYNNISLEQAVAECARIGDVIFKPTVDTSCGTGICFWRKDDGVDKLKALLGDYSDCIVQEIIHQHPSLAALHENSVNSIRMVTCSFQGKTEVLSSVIRIGAGESRIDNATRGGVFCGVTDSGRLRKYAHDKKGNVYKEHPKGGDFSQCVIPNYDQCKELVIKLSNRFYRIAKLISWDLSVDVDGNPVLIEVNLCYGGATIHQIANGPLYGDKTEAVIRQVFSKKKYRLMNKWIQL